jgi:hypothetical protein
MGALKLLPMVGKDLLEDAPVLKGLYQHRIAPSWGDDRFAVQWFYHASSASSTPHRPVPGHPHPTHLSLSNGDFRDRKNAFSYAIEKLERIAALAMLTVVGLLMYSVIQRQVRLSLRTHDRQLLGNKGETATPTAAVVLSLFSPVAIVQVRLGDTEIRQVYGVHNYHLMVCEALGLDHTWYGVADSA